MKVLVACEYSGRVRDAFLAKGHDAISCDLLPSEKPGPHYRGDVRNILNDGWDLMVGHPDCTFMANSGARWLWNDDYSPNTERWAGLRAGATFFLELWNAPIPRIALENPVMVGYAKQIIGVNQTQTIQPWQFGDGETKRTCLWLKNLPKLKPTNIVNGRGNAVHYASPGPNRWKERSRTFPGIALAVAEQWGNL